MNMSKGELMIRYYLRSKVLREQPLIRRDSQTGARAGPPSPKAGPPLWMLGGWIPTRPTESHRRLKSRPHLFHRLRLLRCCPCCLLLPFPLSLSCPSFLLPSGISRFDKVQLHIKIDFHPRIPSLITWSCCPWWNRWATKSTTSVPELRSKAGRVWFLLQSNLVLLKWSGTCKSSSPTKQTTIVLAPELPFHHFCHGPESDLLCQPLV